MLVVKIGGTSVGVVSFLELHGSKQLLVLGRMTAVDFAGRVGLVGANTVKFLRYGDGEQPWESFVVEKLAEGWTVVEEVEDVDSTLKTMVDRLAA